MKHKFGRQGVLMGWLGLTALGVGAQPVVWVTSSLQRTGPNDSAGSGTQALLYAGKGEYESFQIVVRGSATRVNVTTSNLTGPVGAVIPSSSFSLFREHYVHVSSSSPNWGGSNQPMGTGWYPDGLIPFNDPNTGASLSNSGASLVAAPFSVNASANQPIWVDLLVPRTATAGQYSGTFTVSSDQGNTTGTISLTVWNFTLPLQPSLRSSFLYWNTSGLASDEELLRNRIEPLRETASEQSTLINNYGLHDVALSFWSGADLSNCSMSLAPSTASIKAAVAQQNPGLTPYIYSADEVGSCALLDTLLQQWGYNMHQAGVNNLVTMAPTSILLSDGSGSGRSAVDIWTMLPVSYDGAATMVAKALAKGDSAWSYNTLVQDSYSPKWELDFAPINFRIQPGFISQSLGLTGLLYWKVDGWNTSDPWNQVNNPGVFSSSNYPGEGQLVYPGTQVGISGVAPSMRLKWLRDGEEDYEYVALLKAAGQGSQALSLAQTVGANWSNWTRDPNQLASVRQQLGTLLNQISGGPSAAPPSTSGTSGSGTSSSSGSTSGSSSNGISRSGAPTPPPVSTPSTSAISGTPRSGRGNTETLTLSYVDPSSYANFASAGALINTSATGTNACWFAYNQSTGILSVANDWGTGWFPLPQGGVIGNSQCSISNATATGSGNTLKLTVSITFTSGFSGTVNVYGYDQTNAGVSSGYQSVGTWTVLSH